MIGINKEIETLFTAEQLTERVNLLSKCISADYEGQNPLLIGVLNGCFMFFSDLVRHLEIPAEVDFVRVSSYCGDKSGEVKLQMDGKLPVSGRNVIVVEDILDTGKTLKALTEQLQLLGAKSLKTAVLLDKPSRREVNFKADYVGFEIDDLFVVGYGLDFDEKYRTLPYVGIIK